MGRQICSIAAVILTLAASGAAGAGGRYSFGSTGFAVVDGVNVRNGDFSVTYSKFGEANDNGAKAAFSITYNSLSDHRGGFGRGWGSSLEHKVVHLADDSVLVRYIGSGAIYPFAPKTQSEAVVRKTASQMAAKIVQDDRLPKNRLADLTSRLISDPAYRFEIALKHHLTTPPNRHGELAVDPASGFMTDKCPGETQMLEARATFVIICRTKDHPEYAAQRPDLEATTLPITFNVAGDLKEVFNPYFGRLILAYRQGKLDRLYGQKHAITVRWGRLGIVSMTDEIGEQATFAYDAKGRLTDSADYSGNRYQYAYDSAGRLVSIGYIDGSRQLIAYDFQGRVASVTQRNGDVTRFAYWAAPENTGRHTTRVTRTAASGAKSEQTFEFED